LQIQIDVQRGCVVSMSLGIASPIPQHPSYYVAM
jgi:hypothetical protein